MVSSRYLHLNIYIVYCFKNHRCDYTERCVLVVDAEFRPLIKPFARMHRNARIMFRFVRNAILSQERVSDRNIITGGFHSEDVSLARS